MINPKVFTQREAINSLTGIKSSLGNLRKVISLTYLLYLASKKKSSVVYADSNGGQIILKQEYKIFIQKFLNNNEVVNEIDNNPLLTSQIESLYVGLTLMFALGRISFENSALSMTKERTGGIRYPKKIDFASNIIILDLLLNSDSESSVKDTLLAWLQDKQINNKIEQRISIFLNICIENNLFKLRHGEHDLYFQTEGIYKSLMTGNEVSLESDEIVGPTRILNSMLKENLIPWLNFKKSLLTINKNNDFNIKDYSDIVTTSLSIRDIKVDNNLESTPKEEKEDYNRYEKLLSLQQIFYGAPGTGKSHTINHTTAGEDVIRTTFHPDTDYSTFVGAYKPTTIEETVMTVIGTKAVPVENADGTTRKESKIVYEFVAQAFLQAYVEAWKKVAEAEGEPKKQFLVIEEINRGNCAQIFGDLFQLLDRNDSGFSDYPIQADADMKRQLQKAFSGMELTNKEELNSLYEGRNVAEEVINGDILLLPSNLYIWGTMNTSDQSLFPIDSAFKRRWDWTYMPISNAYKEWTIKVGNDNYDWWSFLESINDKIGSTTNSEDKKLGYFFCKAQNDVIPVEKFVGKVIFYLWNDVFKDYEFCDAIFNDEDGSKLTFAKFYTEEGRNARIVTDKVAVFLKNLGLEPSFIEPDAETNSVPNSESGSQMDYSKYSLNGEGSYSKGGLVYEAVKRYATAHAESTADEIVNTWLRLGINVPYLVETAEEHEQRKQQTSDSRFDQKSKMLELPNHEVIYISNQFNVQRIEDFIEKVNAQPWHLTLAKI